jgi:sulfate/thiosulfate transport system substrate-binding protein
VTSRITRRSAAGLITAALSGGTLAGCARAAQVLTAHTAAPQGTLLNASYDTTRELYEAVNPAFSAQWLAQDAHRVRVLQSHGGSGQQAGAIVNGLFADVATLGSSLDVMQLYSRAHLIPADWATRLPYNSCPYTSTIVFLARRGNPKNVRDWGDLIRPGVQVVTPNPKTSGAGRWAYLAAWAWAQREGGGAGGSAGAMRFMKSLYQHVPVLDAGARGATDTFVERGIGDVLLSWENEARLAEQRLGRGMFTVIVPPLSIRAEPPVTVVDKVVDQRHTRRLAESYLQFLYSPPGQQIIARNFYRPQLPAVAQQFAAQFPPVAQMVTVEQAFGGWARAQAVHFADGGTFDQIYGQ